MIIVLCLPWCIVPGVSVTTCRLGVGPVNVVVGDGGRVVVMANTSEYSRFQIKHQYNNYDINI